jgi:hypothetical protein
MVGETLQVALTTELLRSAPSWLHSVKLKIHPQDALHLEQN